MTLLIIAQYGTQRSYYLGTMRCEMRSATMSQRLRENLFIGLITDLAVEKLGLEGGEGDGRTTKYFKGKATYRKRRRFAQPGSEKTLQGALSRSRRLRARLSDSGSGQRETTSQHRSHRPGGVVHAERDGRNQRRAGRTAEPRARNLGRMKKIVNSLEEVFSVTG